MMKKIIEAAQSDLGLERLLGEVREYASVYVLARQRQKGCDGMGELTTVREEFRDVVDKVIQYSQEKRYISRDVSFDIDTIADEIVRI